MSTSPVSIDLPDGRTISASKGPDGQEPDVFSVRKGPYTAHLLLYNVDSGVQVVPPAYIQKRRPAIFDPEKFFDFSNVTGKTFGDNAEIRGAI